MVPTLIIAFAGLLSLFLLSLTPLGTRFRRWMMAKLNTLAQSKYEPHVAERKQQLFSDLSGTVLEIGPGNGVNFSYLPDGVRRWIGIEPNPFMHAELRAAGAQCGIEADFRTVHPPRASAQSTTAERRKSNMHLPPERADWPRGAGRSRDRSFQFTARR